MVRVVQFGEGVFIRAFLDPLLQHLVDAGLAEVSVSLIQPRRSRTVAGLMADGGAWSVRRRGLVDGEARAQDVRVRIVDEGLSTHEHPQRLAALAADPDVGVIVSNTTEAGLAWHQPDAQRAGRLVELESYPAKLTWMLHRRYEAGVAQPLHVIPLELVDDNALRLREVVLRYGQAWSLGEAFAAWLDDTVAWHNTLVDQIVAGRPGDVAADSGPARWTVLAEWYRLWRVDGDRRLLETLPLDRLPDGCVDFAMVDDLSGIRRIKVGVLNGVHTVMAAVGLEQGLVTVRQAVEDPRLGAWLQEEVLTEVLAVMPQAAPQFAAQVLDRFRNPHIDHRLADIALNTSAKLPVRVGRTVIDRHAAGLGSPALAQAVASWLRLVRDREDLRDDEQVLAALRLAWREETDSVALVGRALGHVTGAGCEAWPQAFVAEVARAL